MEYFKLLQLEREPFSNSPDPDYFFRSHQHLACLQKLELALRLRRGLNVVIGDVGTGKTTLCRELIRKFSQETDFETHLLLDPSFGGTKDFLITICTMISDGQACPKLSEMAIKEKIKQHLFVKGVEHDRKVVLIIDEGQKLPHDCIEILRELLNYETNAHKLLQIVIFAQKEFETVFETHANFADRINLLHTLRPIDFRDTRRMIRHRLKLSSNRPKPLELFTLPAQWAIYRASQGYPRRIIHLCHQSLLAMIVQNRSQAGWRLIQACKNRIAPPRKAFRPARYNAFLFILSAALILVFISPMYLSYLEMEEKTLHHYKVPVSIPPVSIPDDEAPQTVAIQSVQTIPFLPSEGVPSAPSDIQKAAPDVAPGMGAAEPLTVDQEKIASLPANQRPPGAMANGSLPQENTSSTVSTSAPLAPPEVIGRVIVQPGDSLGAIIRKVYGAYRNQHVKALLETNRHIQNPDNIRMGEAIVLPALQFGTRPDMPACHWINLQRYADIEMTLQKAKQMQERTPANLRPFASWSPDEGMQYHLMVKGYFTDPKTARAYLASLPPELAADAQIISGWPEKAVLFSDPYSGGVLSP